MIPYHCLYILSILTIPKKRITKINFFMSITFPFDVPFIDTFYLHEIANLHRNNMQQVDRSVVSAKDDKTNNE